MTDYEMVLRIKNDDEGHIDLWNKYAPYVNKRAHKFCYKTLVVELTPEDYVQDAYFAFMGAIDYVNLSKVEDAKNRFSFLTVFKNFLSTGVERKYFLKKYQKIEGVAYTENRDENSEDLEYVTDIRNVLDKRQFEKYSPENVLKKAVDTGEIIERLFDEIRPLDREILTLRLEGEKYRQISEELGVSENVVRTHVRSMKRVLSRIVDDVYGEEAV